MMNEAPMPSKTDLAGLDRPHALQVGVPLLADDDAVVRLGYRWVAQGLGCVKTPKLNLRTEISSRLQSF
jgi:hypothetical protein